MSAQSQTPKGLTSAEVQQRIRRGEVNDFKARVGRSYWDIFRDNILNLFNLIFGALLVVVFLFRDYGTFFFAGFSVVTNSFLGMIQEALAKRQLDRLAALAADDIKVWRDGQLASISPLQLVKDDVIPIQPGMRIPVDGVLLHSDALEMDESQLTGESDAVLKNEGDPVVSGSFCIAGSGTMVATQVGRHSSINRLSETAKAYKRVLTPTQQRISLLVQLTVILMLVTLPMVFIAGYLQDQTIITLPTFRSAVVFVASIVPQGLVLTAILALTIGAVNISRKQTLVQRVNAVESMANVTTLCFDKTGTLTQNRLTVMEITPLGALLHGQIIERLALYTGNLSSQNRTAAAVAHYAVGDSGLPALPAVAKTREVPFTSQRKWGAIILPGETLILGAPERVLPRRDVQALEQARTLSTQGLRVLAFARSNSAMQETALDDSRESLALVILHDQVRPGIQDTLAEFGEEQVALKVITGDNLETATEIAREAGLLVTRAYSGDQLEALDSDAFDDAVRSGNLFARIEPETKRRIIAALKRNGEYVAMVGDGVNDVPALKEAHLAIAMNDGAQITKDVADLVLLNNALTTLPLAFREGRAIRQSVFGTMKIFLVKNFYSVIFFILVGFMLMPFPINPIQISWLTFGVINVPATLIAFRAIKPIQMPTFRAGVLDYAVTAGFIGAASMCLVYAVAYIVSGEEVQIARSTVSQYMTLFGTLAYWNIHGVEMFDWRSIRQRPFIFWSGIALCLGTVFGFFMLPRLTEFTAFSADLAALVALTFVFAALLLTFAMRVRFVNRLWRLLAP
ncbi:MAG: HAD-IC family P-type ATPase [Anaerolineae bacterium]|nr:HAD-IC family P-type ATPase [Anaerolineae bacterium]NUQ03248.1 HAD-IC family P-type ATPase [Anaerolineae bacterium]